MRVQPQVARDRSDLWKIDRLYIRENGQPFASLVLVGRAGGLPLGETRTSEWVSLLTRVSSSLSPEAKIGADVALRAVLEALRNEPGALYSAPETTVRVVAMRLGIEL